MPPFHLQLSELTLHHFDRARVWSSDLARGDVETVRPCPGKDTIDATDGAGLWVRFGGTLADGTSVAGIAAAVGDPPGLLLPSLFIEGRWHPLHLPGAPSFVLAVSGPDVLARSLDRRLDQVFPIRLVADVKSGVTGRPIETVLSL